MSGLGRSATRGARFVRTLTPAAGIASLIVGFGFGARAQIPSARPGAPATSAESPAGAPERASLLFERGLLSFESKAFELALDDFRKSLELYPTLVAAKNAALCLRELGRFDEALDLLESLPVQFPNLPAEEIRQNAIKVDDLSSRVGWIELRGVQPSSELVIDDRPRGVVPPSSRARVSNGGHRVRVVRQGMQAAETSVVVVSGQTVVAQFDQRPADTLSERPWTLGVELGGSVTSTIGGDVAGCSSPCERSVGAGGRVIARVGRAVGSALSLSLDAGYLSLGQSVDGRLTNVVVVGNTDNKGTANDALKMTGGLVGVSVAYRLPWLAESFARAGAGFFLGRVRDERHGTFNTSDSSSSYPVDQIQSQAAYYGYLALAVGVGFRPASHLRLGVGLDAMTMIAVRQPHWDASCADCRIAGGRDGESWFADHVLAGRFMVLVSPFVDAGYAF